MKIHSFMLSFGLILVPIGLITYQMVLQENEPDIETIETNIPAKDALVIQENIPIPHGTQKVVIRNKIEKKMLTYHKGFFSLTPNFDLTVNDRPVKQGQQLKVPVVDGKVNVTYAYDFMGHKKGKKSITFAVPENTSELDLTFSWKKEPRIILGNAQALEVKEIY